LRAQIFDQCLLQMHLRKRCGLRNFVFGASTSTTHPDIQAR
jgi:hypothetical protein